MKITAFIIEKKNCFTIFTKGSGGIMISGETLDLAKDKFDKALKLSSAIKNMLTFKEALEHVLDSASNDDTNISKQSNK